ncbi:MAG: type II toxin-antitoxin system VapC family toxin [Steroidobacteraceae bacterium]
MARPIVVPDASVIVKWVLPSEGEDDAARALALRDAIVREQVHVRVPSLWLYEVGNTIARRFPEHAAPWLAALMKFGLEEAPASPRWITTALELATRYGVTFYDAAYHATALVCGGVFVTADAHYFKRARAAGGVELLAGWRASTRS